GGKEGGGGVGCGEVVTLKDQDSGGVEELSDLARQRRPARDRPLQATAERSVQFAEDELVGDGSLEAEPCWKRLAALLVTADLSPDTDGPVKDLLLCRRAGLDA